MLEKEIQFIFGHHHAQFVAAIDDKDDSMALTVVVLPQIAVATLAGHVERCECQSFWFEPLYVETHSRYDIMVFGIIRLEMIDDGRFAWII